MRPDQAIVVVTPQDREEEIITWLARIGFDQVLGYLREPQGAFRTVSTGSLARAA